MVDLQLLQTLSIAIASAGVVAGVVYYGLQLRHLRRQRQTDIVVQLYAAFNTDDFLAALLKVKNLEFKDYKDFTEKYGPLDSETPMNLAILKVANYFDEVGTLVHRELIDADLVCEFLSPSTITFWNKLQPVIDGFRRERSLKVSVWFEYLYNEVKKREQKLHQSKA